ncbi:DUF5667 domain-containing protein [Chloroflexota bacterium]
MIKKVFMVFITALLALTFCFSGVAYAQEEEALPDPGTTPDSAFYFMDKWGKSLSLAFTFNAERKAQKALRYADERMAEIDAMMAKNKIKEATKAANEYQNCLGIATKNMEQAKLKGADVSEQMALVAGKHLGYLSDSTANATEDARILLTQTRERAMTCQETALKNMAQGDPEKATRFNLQLMERQLNRIKVRAEESEGEAVQAYLEVYNRLGNLGENISQIAKGLGEETTVDQLVGQATAHHLEVLAEVHQRMQGEGQQAVEATLQNRVQNHEQVVTRLQARNQLGQVPEEAPIPNAFQNRTRQSTQGTDMPTTTQQTQNSRSMQSTETANVTPTQTSQGTQSTQSIETANVTPTQTGQGSSSGDSQQGR